MKHSPLASEASSVKSRRLAFLSCILVLTFMVCLGMPESHTAPAAPAASQREAAAAPSATAQVVGAANAFLATLDEKQRAKVLFAFGDDKQRARWSNFPTGFVPRGGVSLRELNDAQRAAALALVAAALSPRGFEKVQQIMEADDVFKATNHGPPPFARDHPGGQDRPSPGAEPDGHRGPPPVDGGKVGNQGPPPFGDTKDVRHGPPPLDKDMFGKDLYYLSILGTPSEKEPWMLQYGGHHLALNITVVGERGVLTPTLTGAQPATYTVNGKTVRPLGQENDKGFALLSALNETQRRQAILNYQVADLVLGPGHDGQTIQPEGLQASAMDDQQRAMLLDLISEWTGIVNDAYATARLAEIKAGLDDTWFAWSGPTTLEPGKQNGTAYYRIQGPKLVIEFAPQHEEDHVHTMYRDPTNDYGRAFTAGQ